MVLAVFLSFCKFRDPAFKSKLFARRKTSLDVSWLKDECFFDLNNLPDFDVLTEEIVKESRKCIGKF